MKVRVAKSAGFCMGVRRAMDSVLDVARGNDVTYTYGPLVHNPQALKMLESRDIYVTNEVTDELTDKTVVTRAHGITIQTSQALQNANARIVDATCPKVVRSQIIIKKYFADGYSIVIIGDRGHPEVDSLLSYTDGSGIVVENMDEARALLEMDKVCVVAQTTFNDAIFLTIANEVASHALEHYIADTVCAATERRQADVRKLAEQTDATVVVGGKNSANTCRLVEISLSLGQPTFHVEEASELDYEKLSEYNEIGVTAGASTPNWVIKEVVDNIVGYSPTPSRSLTGFFMSLAFFALEGNFMLCAGAAVLTYAMCLFMSIHANPLFSLMSFFYLFPLHAVNKYLEINWTSVSLKDKASNLRIYWRIFLGFAAILFVISLFLAYSFGMLVFSVVVVSYLFGGLYSVKIIPANWNIHFKSLRDIPGSKDIVITTAWTFVTVILPAITQETFPWIFAAYGSFYVFTIVFSRATIYAIGGIESDKLVGFETIPVLIGRDKTVRLLYLFTSILAMSFTGLIVIGVFSLDIIVLLIPIAFLMASIRYFSKHRQFFRYYHQFALDSVFYLTGIVAFLFLR